MVHGVSVLQSNVTSSLLQYGDERWEAICIRDIMQAYHKRAITLLTYAISYDNHQESLQKCIDIIEQLVGFYKEAHARGSNDEQNITPSEVTNEDATSSPTLVSSQFPRSATLRVPHHYHRNLGIAYYRYVGIGLNLRCLYLTICMSLSNLYAVLSGCTEC